MERLIDGISAPLLLLSLNAPMDVAQGVAWLIS